MTERIFVTGATGFLGGRLCKKLRKEGYGVFAVGRNRNKLDMLEGVGCRTAQLDLSLPFAKEILEVAGDCGTIVHCAALSSTFGPKSWFVKANIEATKNVCAFAELANMGRQIYISSPSIYFDFADRNMVGEDDPLPAPINHYAMTKKAGENIALSSKVPAVILRPRGIYGQGDNTLLPRLMRVAQKRPLPLMRGGNAQIDLTHVEDVVGSIMAAIKAPKSVDQMAFNISSGEALRIVDIVEKVSARLKFKPRWIKVPFPIMLGTAHLLEFIYRYFPTGSEPPITGYSVGLFAFQQSLDISRAKQVLGWTPLIGFERGLNEVFSTGGQDAADI